MLFPLTRGFQFLWAKFKVSAKISCASHWHRKGICGKTHAAFHACSWNHELQPSQQACSLLWHEELDQYGAYQTEMFAAHMSNPLKMSMIDLRLSLLYISSCFASSPKNNSHMNCIKVINYHFGCIHCWRGKGKMKSTVNSKTFLPRSVTLLL